MKQFSQQNGTAVGRRYGLGQVWSPIDQEDWEIGQSMLPDAAPPQSTVYADAGPLVQASDGQWVDRAFDLAQKALTLDQMRKLQKVNLDRVQRGLAPLPDSVYRQVQPGINVGIAPSTEKFIWIGLGVAALFVVVSMVGKGR